MAASLRATARIFCQISPSVLHQFRPYPRLPVKTYPGLPLLVPPSHSLCKAASLQDEDAAQASDALSRYKDKPWDYLESEEYIERYGTNPVWKGYRRNHKGGIPPQKTRKTCIRGDKICGNPCPVCQDPNIIIHHQNVKLLQQFISPHTGMVYDPTRTGLCMKQQKKLTEAINTAQDHGLLHFQIPYVEFLEEEYSNSHDAVGTTPPPKFLTPGDTWYKWYGEMTPEESEVAKVKKIYKAYLK